MNKLVTLGAIVATLLCMIGCQHTSVNSNWVAIEERINPALPEGFKEGFRHRDPDNSYIIEYVPTGQSVDNWQEMITVQYFPIPNVLSEQFYDQLTTLMSKVCENFSKTSGRTEPQRGYTVTRGMTFCGKNPQTGLGEVTQYSIARGLSGIHILQRAIRVPTFMQDAFTLPEEQKADWRTFYDNSTVCSTTGNKSLCVPL